MKRLLFWLPLIAFPLIIGFIYFRPNLSLLSQLSPKEIDLVPPTLIQLSGTGSMYPTFPKGVGKTMEERSKETVTSIPMYPFTATPSAISRFFYKTKIVRGDIIDFSNPKVLEITNSQYGRPAGLVKRVIGLPGETIEIRDGYTLINGQPLLEPYIAQAHSTFGGEFLPDCKPLKIPEDHLFVMGDNRKGSGDSRHDIGLVNLSDIDSILPLSKQGGKYDINWRDTTNDFLPSTKIKIDKQLYLAFLNNLRQESGVQTLKYSSTLEHAARLRGEAMLKYDDFSYEATRSGLTQQQALTKANYTNPLWGETWRIGYYEAQELIENQFEFPQSKKFLQDPQFQEVGIAEVEGQLHGCPTQVLVLHFGGYVPPNYSSQVVQSWKQALINLREIQPGWADLKNAGPFYSQHKADVDRINTIINTRISNLTPIVQRMEGNLWLTREQNQYIDQDAKLAEEQNQIATRLNQN